METHFSEEFFKANRQRLATLFGGTAPIVITASGLLQRSADATFPFRQDSNFWYLTGINEPDVILVIDKEKEYLIVPERTQSREVFDGSIQNEELAKISGVKTVLDSGEGWKQLGGRLKRAKHVASFEPSPAFIEAYGLFTNPARARLLEKIRGYNPEIVLINLRSQMAAMRVVKQPQELRALTKAIEITVKSLKRLNYSKYKYENEVEAEITRHFRRHGYDHAYQPIVASGKNACTLHYIANKAPLNKKDLLLIDTGAEVENYAADITRTYSISEPSKRQQAVYSAVLSAQEYAFSLLKPGVLLKDYEDKMEHFLGEKLREIGLIKVIDKENVRKYCPHSVSHFLGLDVHDAGNYKRPLETGMVLTVEPGIYIPAEGIGVRIEDDVLITEEGIKVLSKKLPKIL